MTESARVRIDAGVVSRMTVAVFMLMTSSSLAGCSTGRSAGFAPFRILSTKPTASFSGGAEQREVPTAAS